MIKTSMMMAIAAATVASEPANAGPEPVLQGPSATGMAPLQAGTGGACSVWRCGLNGVSTNGLTLNGFTLNGLALNGWTLNGTRLNGSSLSRARVIGFDAPSMGFATTAVTLPGGEVLAID